MKKCFLMILMFLFINSNVLAVGSVSGSLTPNNQSLTVGGKVTTKVVIDSGVNSFSGINLKLNFDTSKLKVSSVKVDTTVLDSAFVESVTGNEIRLSAISTKTTSLLPKGRVEIATIVFEGLAEGGAVVSMVSTSKISGPSSMLLSWQNANYTVGSVINGNDYVLNYKVAFANVSPASTKCLVSWPLKITAMGSSGSKIFDGVVPGSQEVVGDKLVFGGSLNLTGFNDSSGVSFFIKGPKHLQMKYGKNNQTSSYDLANGELTLTKSNTPVYDFSGYQMLAGDVVSSSSQSSQDGYINGVDFAYVKSRSLIHETVLDGEYLLGDLNGDCQVNSNDVNILKISLENKQEQLY